MPFRRYWAAQCGPSPQPWRPGHAYPRQRMIPASRGAVHDLLEGLQFIKQNTVFSFLICLTFFSSFFGMAYIPLMPVFAVDILQVGAKGQGLLLGVGGIGSLATSAWLATRSDRGSRGLLIIGGSLMTGLSGWHFPNRERQVESSGQGPPVYSVLRRSDEWRRRSGQGGQVANERGSF